MAVPDFETLIKPVLEAVAQGEIESGALRETVAAAVRLSADDLAERLPSGRQTTFANRVAWANVSLQRAGLIERVSRGSYAITERGRAVLAEKPERLDIGYLQRFEEFGARGQNTSKIVAAGTGSRSSQVSTPDELIEGQVLELWSALATEVLDRLRGMTPLKFEQVIVDLLVAMGYGGGRAELARATSYTNDEGVDGIINEDQLGLDQVFVQAKRYAATNTVGRPDIQAFVGSLVGRGTSKGVFVTTSSFSQGARDYAERVPQRLILIDGARLAELMVRHNVGVRVRRSFEIKSIDEDFFIEE